MEEKLQENKFKERFFLRFVKEVLYRKAIECDREIEFDYRELISKKKELLLELDAICYGGFEDFVGPVIFEIKPRSYKYSSCKQIESRIKSFEQFKNATVIFIINERISIDEKSKDILIWDLSKIDSWINKYPIEYFIALHSEYDNKANKDEFGKRKDLIDEGLEYDFEKLKGIYINGILQIVKKRGPLGLVLGAGVSVEQGASSWDQMLKNLMNRVKNENLVYNPNDLAKMVGGSSLTTAQMCKDIFKDENEFLWEIHNNLYNGSLMSVASKTELEAVARLASRYKDLKHFRILTYNFDNYLEKYLDREGLKYSILENQKDEYRMGMNKTQLYEMRGKVDDNFCVYHVHGYLPMAPNKSSVRGSICLTEADYNLLYNQPYSWPIVSQMSFFRENICLFIGCSLTDPNIRRLLELSCINNRWHYAILRKEKLTTRDLVHATAHFYRLGVRIIWIDSFDEIYDILETI